MCGIALEIVQLRIALSLETQPLLLPNLELEFRRFNGQLQCEDCVARFEAALEQEAPKSDQEGQTSSKEACKARAKAPLELGAKKYPMCSKSQRWIFLQINTTATLLDTEGFNLKTIWHGLVTLLPFERLAGPKTRKGDPGKS